MDPLKASSSCTIPAIFIHAKNDNFVAPKHSLTIYENYACKTKEIVLIEGDHNSARPYDAFNFISLFLYRYLLPLPIRKFFSFDFLLFGFFYLSYFKFIFLLQRKQCQNILQFFLKKMHNKILISLPNKFFFSFSSR